MKIIPIVVLIPLLVFSQLGILSSGGSFDSSFKATIGEPIGDTIHFGNSILFSGFMPAAIISYGNMVDRTWPRIVPLAPFSLSTASGFTLSFNALDSLAGIRLVRFHYKVGGEKALHIDTLEKDNGVYTKSIIGNPFDEKGFFFFAEAIDSQGNSIIYPDTSNDSSGTMVALSSGLSFQDKTGSPFPSDKWRMFSMPILTGEKSPYKILEPILGPHDGRHWKIVRWDGTRYASPSEDALTPGKAFFLYVRDKTTEFGTGPGKTVRIDKPYRITLAPKQFTQIGCPFAFPIAWNDFFASDSARITSGIVPPLSDQYAGVGYLGLDSNPILIPWRGYWVYNPNDSPFTLTVKPYSPSLAKKMENQVSSGFLMSLSLEEHSMVTFGALKEMKKNIPCPPPISIEKANLYFEGMKDAPSTITDFTFQDTSGNNHVFSNLILCFNMANKVIIRHQSTGTQPEACIMFDQKYHTATNLLASDNITVEKNGQEESRAFSLVCGTRGFVEGYLATLLRDAPDSVIVGSPNPNPFNPVTKISFGLPRAEDPYGVQIRIWDISGRLICEPFRGALGPGQHGIMWDGKTGSGDQATSGIYFCTIDISGKDKIWSKKTRMALIR